jgi:DNA-binding CsgD family transcriptional regulator
MRVIGFMGTASAAAGQIAIRQSVDLRGRMVDASAVHSPFRPISAPWALGYARAVSGHGRACPASSRPANVLRFPPRFNASSTAGRGAGDLVPFPGNGGIGHGSASLDQLCRAAFVPVVLVDDARRYLRVNASAEELLAAPADKLLGMRIEDFTSREAEPLLDALWSELERRGELHGTYQLVRADGSPTVIEFRAKRDVMPGQHLLVGRELGSRTHSSVTLSLRQREVLQMAADGNSSGAIARCLGLRPATVDAHFRQAYRKLGVRGRPSAVAEALRRGLIR